MSANFCSCMNGLKYLCLVLDVCTCSTTTSLVAIISGIVEVTLKRAHVVDCSILFELKTIIHSLVMLKLIWKEW